MRGESSRANKQGGESSRGRTLNRWWGETSMGANRQGGKSSTGRGANRRGRIGKGAKCLETNYLSPIPYPVISSFFQCVHIFSNTICQKGKGEGRGTGGFRPFPLLKCWIPGHHSYTIYICPISDNYESQEQEIAMKFLKWNSILITTSKLEIIP